MSDARVAARAIYDLRLEKRSRTLKTGIVRQRVARALGTDAADERVTDALERLYRSGLIHAAGYTNVYGTVIVENELEEMGKAEQL